jgi:simple sugar transport system substrate-binding protein
VLERFPLCVFTLLFAALALVADAATPEPMRVAFLYEHPINAGGWSQSHEQARQRVQAAFGDRIATAAFEGIIPGPDTVRVLTKLAREGYHMIFATSFGHMNPVIKVARQFPEVHFEHASGYKQAPNVGTYQIRAREGRYLAGLIAGAMTKTGRIGYIGAFPIPEVVRGINAFTLGVRSVNPDAVARVIWINTWLDPSKERDAAELLIGEGADVITHHTETPAPAVAAEAAGVYFIGYQYDRSAFAPTRHLATVEHNWLPIYERKIEENLNGTWQPEALWAGIREDASRLVGLSPDIPADIRTLVEQTRTAIAAGEREVFRGPLVDTGGMQRVPAGSALDAHSTLNMEWFVQGVEGGK